VVRRCVWSRKLQEWGGHDPRWVAAPQENKGKLCYNNKVLWLSNNFRTAATKELGQRAWYMNGLLPAWLKDCGSIHGMGKGFWHSIKFSNRPWGLISLVFNGHQDSLSGAERPECYANHSPQYSAQIKNEWRCIYTPPICLHDIERDNLTLTLKSTA